MVLHPLGHPLATRCWTLVVLLVAQPICGSSGLPLQPISGLQWEEAVYKAAEVAVGAIRLQSGAELSLRGVPLDTLQVYTGRQHQIGLSLDGIQYEVVLGSDQELSHKAAQKQAQALPAAQQRDGGSPSAADEDPVTSGLVRQHWQSQGSAPGAPQLLTLPDVSLSGPLELTLAGGLTPVAFFTPHAVDMGPVRRMRLAAGVTVKVSGLRSIQLRRPLDLPSLPVGFLAEVYAHAKLKEAGEGFDKAPGIHYLANQLRSLALNSSLPLLSLEVAPADPSLGLVVSASSDAAGGAPTPRLKVKREKDGGVDISLRQGELTVAHGGDNDVLRRSSALARPWAWPLPHVDLSSLVPLEALLRSILAAHPFDLGKVQRQGISMKLTKSEITGTRLMAFEMEVRSRNTQPSVPQGLEQLYEDFAFNDDAQLLVFDVVVSVREKQGGATSTAGGGAQEYVYVPVSVKLKDVHGSTLSMSQGTLQAMLYGNGTHPAVGYDHQDLGLARQEGAQ